MSSLKSKLDAFYGKADPLPQQDDAKRDQAIADQLDAEIIETSFGRCLVRSRLFPATYTYGQSELGAFLNLKPTDFVFLGIDWRLEDMHARNLAVIDTETTGLMGGAGTLAFLVGVGRWTPDGFQIRQFFLRDPGDEYTLLHLLSQELDGRSGLISYNGKSYDLPLLRNRFVLNRLQPPEYLPHLDLLHTVRRLWRHRWERCDLQSCERYLLGFRREGDIPGHQIPELYFQFLRDKDASALKRVFQHNVMDILTLINVATHAIKPFQLSRSGNHVQANIEQAIRSVESLMLYEHAERLYHHHVSRLTASEAGPILLRRAKNLKRIHQPEKAAEIYETLISHSGHFYANAYIEWAKVLEHHKRDFAGALQVVERALEIIDRMQELSGSIGVQHINDLNKRRERLKRKVERNSAGDKPTLSSK
jgi:hypothetical protein